MQYEAAIAAGGVMALVSALLSLHLIGGHRKNWAQPVQQANIVKIIAMSPLFALDSFVGLLELEDGETVAHVVDMVKECYEAIALHSFLMLMYDLCGLTSHLQKKKVDDLLPEGVKGRELHLPFPVGLLFDHPLFDQKWLKRLRLWTLQFVILRPILSVIDLILVDIVPNPFSKVIGVAIAVVLNLSVTTAFFALITFYHAFERELAPHRPLAKFICIKGVVFFATWQGVVLKLLAHFGFLHDGYRFSVDEIELAWQDLLVCIEMGILFSPLHLYAFPTREFSQYSSQQANIHSNTPKPKEVELTEKKTN